MTTDSMMEMARRCAAKYWQTGDDSDEGTARMILSGDWDDQAYVQAALAAIKEERERCAKVAEGSKTGADADFRSAWIAQAIRGGQP